MTATNHTITGCFFIAATVGHAPLAVALPAAFLLHFVLDALPHFGEPNKENWSKSLSRLRWFLPIDACIAAAVLVAIFIIRPPYWLAIIAGGTLCASPDLFSINRFRRFLKNGDTSFSTNWFNQFHHKIQWGERPWGIWLELVWAVVFGFLLFSYV